MSSFPDWLTDILKQSCIHNEIIENYPELNTPFDLSTYHLICIGNINNVRHHAYVRLHSYHSTKPLQGPHLVSIYFGAPKNAFYHLWVSSLTTLRKQFFHFEDRLSFERSTYIILPEKQKLIRLKNVRGFLRLHFEKQIESIYINNTTSIPYNISNNGWKKSGALTLRTKQQIDRLLRHIFTSFQRDLCDYEMKDIFQSFEEEIIEYIQSLRTQYLI